LTFRDGAPQRWHIVNAAKSRYFQLFLGEAQPFMVIGVDGGGLEYSVQRDRLVLAPGERMDVILAPRAEAGGTVVLKTVPFDRGFGSIEFRTVEDLMVLVPAAGAAMPSVPLPTTRRTIAPMDAGGATPVRL
jgi:FtsP/CotA-like multicopper oxidase with cupredoxin domain